MKTRRTVWLGLGTFAAGAALAPLAQTQAQTKPASHAHDAPAKPTAGGEGGEGGEAGAAHTDSLSANLKFYRAVALIRGHLLVGDELVKAGRWTEALPHFLHPGEEIYPSIKDDLRAFGVRPFESGLKSLAQTVKAKRAEPYGAALELVRGQIGPADESLRNKEQDWTRFVVETALEVLRQATDEYGEAIEGGRFAKVVEYQDARGFVWEADRLIESVADALKAKDAEALESLRADMTALKAAWPSAMPPAKPVKDLGGVLGDVARVELHAGRFL